MSSKMDELERRGYKGYDENGQLVSSLPVRLPVGFKQVDNFAQRVREIVRGERLRAEAEAAGQETFEEADDFDIPDDPVDPATPYEADFDVPTPGEIRKALKAQFDAEDEEDRYRAARRRRHDVRRVGEGSGKSGSHKRMDKRVKDRDEAGEADTE